MICYFQYQKKSLGKLFLEYELQKDGIKNHMVIIIHLNLMIYYEYNI